MATWSLTERDDDDDDDDELRFWALLSPRSSEDKVLCINWMGHAGLCDARPSETKWGSAPSPSPSPVLLVLPEVVVVMNMKKTSTSSTDERHLLLLPCPQILLRLLLLGDSSPSTLRFQLRPVGLSPHGGRPHHLRVIHILRAAGHLLLRHGDSPGTGCFSDNSTRSSRDYRSRLCATSATQVAVRLAGPCRPGEVVGREGPARQVLHR